MSTICHTMTKLGKNSKNISKNVRALKVTNAVGMLCQKNLDLDKYKDNSSTELKGRYFVSTT